MHAVLCNLQRNFNSWAFFFAESTSDSSYNINARFHFFQVPDFDCTARQNSSWHNIKSAAIFVRCQLCHQVVAIVKSNVSCNCNCKSNHVQSTLLTRLRDTHHCLSLYTITDTLKLLQLILLIFKLPQKLSSRFAKYCHSDFIKTSSVFINNLT